MTIRSLASSFGISIMPVREALRRLVAEHVLMLLPNRSVALPVFTRDRFHEITRIRTSLEGLAAEEGARHVTPEMLTHMAHMTSLMETKTAVPLRPTSWRGTANSISRFTAPRACRRWSR